MTCKLGKNLIMFGSVLFVFIDAVLLSDIGPQYEGNSVVIPATAIPDGMTRTITNITFTIGGSLVRELVNVNMVAVFLSINISASLNGKSVTCMAVLDTGGLVSCSAITLQVQGKSCH